jgi:hypothetical protein
MGAMASDRDDDWREYERTGKFLIFIWRTIYERSFGLRLPRLSRTQSTQKTEDFEPRGFDRRDRRFGRVVLSR